MEASSQFGTSLNQDSGGITAQTNGALAIHGALPRDGTTALNGMDVSNALSAGAGQMFGLVSDGGMEEMAVETAGHSAEAALGGVRINLVPREGANESEPHLAGQRQGQDQGLLQLRGLAEAERPGGSAFQSLDRAGRVGQWALHPGHDPGRMGPPGDQPPAVRGERVVRPGQFRRRRQRLRRFQRAWAPGCRHIHGSPQQPRHQPGHALGERAPHQRLPRLDDVLYRHP